MLVLGFNFAISPGRMCCLRSQIDSQFFCPVNEFGIDESRTTVMHNRLRDSKGTMLFLHGIDCSLSTSLSNWVYHQKSRKCINDQETMKVPITWWVKRSFVIYVNCSERNSLNLSFFYWYFVPVFRLRFVVLAGETINSKCRYPNKHTRPVVESFCIVISLCGSHVSAQFAVMSKSETC